MNARHVAALALAALLAARPACAVRLECAAGLARGLAAGGRAEAALRYDAAVPGRPVRAVHALLALETPGLARMDVSGSGEKLVLRADGGEWLQPSTRQLLRFAPRQAAAALRWWRVLLETEPSARERRTAPGTWVLVLLTPSGAAQDSAEVRCDARGLPVRLTVPAGDPDGVVYRLGGWRFGHARGAAGFRIALPAGYEAVDLP